MGLLSAVQAVSCSRRLAVNSKAIQPQFIVFHLAITQLCALLCLHYMVSAEKESFVLGCVWRNNRLFYGVEIFNCCVCLPSERSKRDSETRRGGGVETGVNYRQTLILIWNGAKKVSFAY